MADEQKATSTSKRVPVDVGGLRDRVAQAYDNNPLWEKLSLSQQLRQLIEDGLEVAEGQKKKRSK
jgi:hypothetical protein